MDNLKLKVEGVIEKVKSDPNFESKFKAEPVKALEEVMGMDLPDDKINSIIQTINTKIALDDSNILGKLKGFFN